MNKPTRHRLPQAYTGFADLFALFAPPMVQTLGGMLAAFASRLEMPMLWEAQPQGEFVGFDGIAQTGDLAHLLESDWLLRELDPDDFVRRVSEREVLYRQRAFEDTGKRNALAVVLDCGPWMLGRNRLCGLAALFHLAAVAERSGAELKWIVPGQPKDGWITGLSRDTITRYLGQIVQTDLDLPSLQHAIDGLEVEGRLELWYIGAAETAPGADALGVTSSFLIETLHGEGSPADARVMVRGPRRKTTIDITFPGEETCVAALRRPFQPKPQTHRASSTDGAQKDALSPLPYDSDWMLDRHNQAVVLRVPEGILWQPLLPDTGKALWIPMKEGTLVAGIAIDREGGMSLIYASPGTDSADDGPVYDLTKMHIARADGVTTTASYGRMVMNAKSFPVHGIPPLQQQNMGIITSDGRRRALTPTDPGKLQTPVITKPRVLFCSAHYRVDLTTSDPKALRVTSLNRNTVMLAVPTDDRITSLAGQARQVLFSPSSKALAISGDGSSYTLYSEGDEDHIDVPEGQHALQLEASHRGTVWEPSTGQVKQISFKATERPTEVLAETNEERLSMPRYCPMTGTIFALQKDEHGRPAAFLPLVAKRGWGAARKITLVDAIAEAQTEWPDA